ncbi:DNA repair helicase UVH6-like [Hibiscus syriacus]|uniref:DNA repair helicase UVH6-like n=1 Tax=Hibiscus syriacus TaxID=106335 RepID=A0A6A2YT29_HIBSY|nr:DNA repair helicase UVH6-like [Hibiscus syriacus]
MLVPLPLPPPRLQWPKPQPPPTEALNFDTGGNNNNVVPVSLSPSTSRWPKAEIEALIKLRTNLNIKYQDNGAKGPIWEEISSAMRNLGYNRSSKRCKEKWENINKYYKKVKENNKTKPEDSKTCPYFHQLDALYKEKFSKPDGTMVPLMVRPEQQWPPQQEVIRQGAALMEEEADRENPDQVQDNEDDGDTSDEYEGMIST